MMEQLALGIMWLLETPGRVAVWYTDPRRDKIDPGDVVFCVWITTVLTAVLGFLVYSLVTSTF